MGFNYHRQSSFSLAPYGGFAALASACLLDTPHEMAEDPPLTRRFITYVNSHRLPPDDRSDMYYKQDYNLWMVEERFRENNGLGRKQINELGALYWRRAIKEHPRQYGHYLLAALDVARWNLLLAATLACGSWALCGRGLISADLAKAACAMAGVHILSLVSTAAIGPVSPRHDMMTGVPVVVALICVSLAAIRNEQRAPKLCPRKV
jgi:hypothetical protein